MQGSPTSGASASIVGGLLDYLNESWTQFHATGIENEYIIRDIDEMLIQCLEFYP